MFAFIVLASCFPCLAHPIPLAITRKTNHVKAEAGLSPTEKESVVVRIDEPLVFQILRNQAGRCAVHLMRHEPSIQGGARVL